MEFLVVVALYQFVIGIFCANLASVKGYSEGAWFFGGWVFGFIALIALIGYPNKKSSA